MFNFFKVARQALRRHWGALGRSEGFFHELTFQHDLLSRDQVLPPGGCGKAEIYSSDTERWKSGTVTTPTNRRTPYPISIAEMQRCAFHTMLWRRVTLSFLNPQDSGQRLKFEGWSPLFEMRPETLYLLPTSDRYSLFYQIHLILWLLLHHYFFSTWIGSEEWE